MGFWGGFGKILGAAAPIIAAPFTGGASLAGLPAVLGTAAKVGGAIAPVLGGMAQGRAQGKQAEGNLAAQENEQRLALFRQMSQNAQAKGQQARDLAQFQLEAPSARFKQGMQGNLAANMQDVRAEHPRANVVHFQGGMRPSAIGQGGRDLGAQLAQLAASKMGKDSYDLPQMPGAPQMQGMPKSGMLDKLIGGAAGASGLMGSLGGLMGGKQDLPSRPMPGLNIPNVGQSDLLQKLLEERGLTEDKEGWL